MNTYIKTITLRGARASQFNVKTVRVSSRRIHTDDQHDIGTWEFEASLIFDALERRSSIKINRRIAKNPNHPQAKFAA